MEYGTLACHLKETIVGMAVSSQFNAGSSRNLREAARLVSEGHVKGVAAIFGRHHVVAGTVVHGRHVGRLLGFLTANLIPRGELLPPPGVYAVKVRVAEALYNGACSIGTNPTFDEAMLTSEVFLLDFSSDLYGREISIYFVDRLRGVERFPDQFTLKVAIAEDVERCREILKDAVILT